jgi:hypothetical protein
MAKKKKSQEAPSKQLKMSKSRAAVRLDLGGGQNVREGFEGVDVFPGSKHVVDLFKFPWPFADNSVDELHCSHFVEHIPLRDVEMSDLTPEAQASAAHVGRNIVGKDMLFAFFDECYRILKPGGDMRVIVPALRNNRAFQDPTHRRFLPAEMFLYLSAEWRKLNRLDHYKAECNFGINVNPTVPSELNLLTPEVATMRINNYWNVVIDWDAQLKSLKPAT